MRSSKLSSREHDKFLQQYPLLATIGNTPLVRVDVLTEEFPELTVSAKLESVSYTHLTLPTNSRV